MITLGLVRHEGPCICIWDIDPEGVRQLQRNVSTFGHRFLTDLPTREELPLCKSVSAFIHRGRHGELSRQMAPWPGAGIRSENPWSGIRRWRKRVNPTRLQLHGPIYHDLPNAPVAIQSDVDPPGRPSPRIRMPTCAPGFLGAGGERGFA